MAAFTDYELRYVLAVARMWVRRGMDPLHAFDMGRLALESLTDEVRR